MLCLVSLLHYRMVASQMSLWGQMVLLYLVENLEKTVFWAGNSQMEGFVSFKFIYAVSCAIASSKDGRGSDVSVKADGSFIPGWVSAEDCFLGTEFSNGGADGSWWAQLEFVGHLLSFDDNGCTAIDGAVSEATAFPSFETVTFDLKSCMQTQNGLYFIAGKSSPSPEKYSNPFSHGVYIKSHVSDRSTSKNTHQRQTKSYNWTVTWDFQ